MASQHDLTIDNQTFPSFRSDLNAALQALGALSWGPTAPATTFAYQLWADSANDLLKQRNAANSAWISKGTLSAVDWGHIAASLLTTRGDIITRGASAAQRLALGSARQLLKSDGTDVLWASLLDSAFHAHKNSVDQTAVASGVQTDVTFGTESLDVAGDFASSIWTPKACQLAILHARVSVSAGVVDQNALWLYLLKNGSTFASTNVSPSGAFETALQITGFAVAPNGTDQYKVAVQLYGTGAKTISGTVTKTAFMGIAL